MSFVKSLLPLRYILALLLIVGIINATDAQQTNFDADSIYYTPLARTSPPTVERNVRIFRDTTQQSDVVGHYFDVSTGMVFGCSDCITGTEFTFATSTTYGITLGRKTRIGAGVGFNTYVGWQALPLFGSVSYDLAGTKNTHAVFIQGQYGWSFMWRKMLPFEIPAKEIDGGVMYAALLGYRLRYHNLRISIAGGFRQQLATSIYETETWIPSDTGMMVPGSPNRTKIETSIGRGVLNLAFSWN